MLERLSLVDLLSPPFVLDHDDAMGRYTGKYDSNIFGSAIIEFRGIRRVGNYFLNKLEINVDREGDFFLKHMESITNQAMRLFNFIKSFDCGENLGYSERKIFG
jgi:hypothetical protein